MSKDKVTAQVEREFPKTKQIELLCWLMQLVATDEAEIEGAVATPDGHITLKAKQRK